MDEKDKKQRPIVDSKTSTPGAPGSLEDRPGAFLQDLFQAVLNALAGGPTPLVSRPDESSPTSPEERAEEDLDARKGITKRYDIAEAARERFFAGEPGDPALYLDLDREDPDPEDEQILDSLDDIRTVVRQTLAEEMVPVRELVRVLEDTFGHIRRVSEAVSHGAVHGAQ